MEQVIERALAIQERLNRPDTTEHQIAAQEADDLWYSIQYNEDESLVDVVGMEMLFLTDVRNAVRRDHDIDNARSVIWYFIDYNQRKLKTTN